MNFSSESKLAVSTLFIKSDAMPLYFLNKYKYKIFDKLCSSPLSFCEKENL